MTGASVVYRASAKVIAGLAGVMAVSFGPLLFRAVAGDVGVDVVIWVGVAVAGLCGFLLAMATRAVTVVSERGVTVRQLFGTRHYPWAQIADIRIAPMSGTGVLSAVIYDARLRRVFLPQVTDKLLGPERLDHEVGELRHRWEATRGPDFRSRAAEVTERVGASRTRFWTAQRIALTVGLALGVTAGLIVALL